MRAAQVRARELVLALGDGGDEPGDVERVRAQRVRRHLTMEHRRADVGVVGRELTPIHAAVLGSTRTTPTSRLLYVSIASILTRCPPVYYVNPMSFSAGPSRKVAWSPAGIPATFEVAAAMKLGKNAMM